MPLILPLRVWHSLAVAAGTGSRPVVVCLVFIHRLLKLYCAENLILLWLLARDGRRLDRSLDLRAFYTATAKTAALTTYTISWYVIDACPFDSARVKYTRFVGIVLVHVAPWTTSLGL